jgi:hypothetical protein
MCRETKSKRPSFQEVKKRVTGKCLFCGESNYNVLDVHRIVPGAEGGKYTPMNSITLCATCHRLVHSGEIVIEGKYKTSRAVPIVYYWEHNEYKSKYEENGRSL